MGNTHYLSDREERLVLHALETQEIMEGDRGNREKSDEYAELYNKIREKGL